MKEITALTVTSALAVMQVSPLVAQAQAAGIVTGTVSGTQGPLAAVTVQVLDASGSIVGSAVTSSTGMFSIPGLQAGTFSVQVIGANGAVIGASTATLAEGAMVAAVTVNATAAAVAAAATAAATTAAAAGSAISTTAVVAAVGAAAAAVGTAAVISTKEDVSGSR